MKKKYLLSFFIIIIVAEIFLFFKSYNISRSRDSESSSKINQISSDIDIEKERKYWSQRLDKIGQQRAYEEFVKEYLPKDIASQHRVAHIIGELLYKKGGIKAIAVCDGNFSFGCYHSFFGSAISDKGISIVAHLDRACIEQFGPLKLGCPHGIGHGILEYLGHDKFLDALYYCEPLTWQGPILGCSGGVFMEYNFPTIVNGSTAITQLRNLDSSNPYGPCPSLPSKFRQSCYYELTQWWVEVLQADFTKMGKLCLEISDLEEQEACFIGIGYQAAPLSRYDLKLTLKKCSKMPGKISKIICRGGASWGFFAMEEYRPLARSLCEGLAKKDQEICLEKADLFKDVEKNLKKS